MSSPALQSILGFGPFYKAGTAVYVPLLNLATSSSSHTADCERERKTVQAGTQLTNNGGCCAAWQSSINAPLR